MHQTPVLFGKEKVITLAEGNLSWSKVLFPVWRGPQRRQLVSGERGKIYDSFIHVILKITFYLSCP